MIWKEPKIFDPDEGGLYDVFAVLENANGDAVAWRVDSQQPLKDAREIAEQLHAMRESEPGRYPTFGYAVLPHGAQADNEPFIHGEAL